MIHLIAAVERASRRLRACGPQSRRRDARRRLEDLSGADVDEAIAAGMTDVGENKVQEARDKKPPSRARALASHRTSAVEQGEGRRPPVRRHPDRRLARARRENRARRRGGG
jgi:hypothetical protein